MTFLRVAILTTIGLTASAHAGGTGPLPPAADHPVDFVRDIQPIFTENCVKCHGPEKQKGDYRLDVKHIALNGTEAHGPPIIPGKSGESRLIKMVAGQDADDAMPPEGPALDAARIGQLRRWIDDGAAWPETASAQVVDKLDWWSLKAAVKPVVPDPTGNPIDAFLIAVLSENGFTLSPEADARTLCRRLHFDLTGLPPQPEEMQTFLADQSPGAYERLIDQLLASPRYGERWARHWLDVVHFGETHGYDKDQPRPNAWPYRDYVIRAFNEDRPYARFVEEQLAGDVLFPGTRDGIEALGFIAAGPWDMIGHAEVAEDKTDGKIARHLDRDDMVANTINTFCSLTVHCAQCHDHKFDPISAENYYSLQSVFAALDRTDRPYDLDPALATQRAALTLNKQSHQTRLDRLNGKARAAAGDAIGALEKGIDALKNPPSFKTNGWHSRMETSPDVNKWVQIDLGSVQEIRKIVLHPCTDNYNGIGDGFGFPLRFIIETSEDATFQTGVRPVADRTGQDVANPALTAAAFPATGSARYLRMTATRLASRKDGFMFALAELEVTGASGENLAAGSAVTSLDSIEAPGAWGLAYLTDRHFPGADPAKAAGPSDALSKLEQARQLIAEAMLTRPEAAELLAATTELAAITTQLNALPKPSMVYAGGIHTGSGSFTGTGGTGGRPRPIHLLARGDVKSPGREVKPGAISGIKALPPRFGLSAEATEGERRAALAHWITDPKHPTTWRSIVNRVWQYHFGRALVGTPNDFGRMGEPPSHPALLDWLAETFRGEMGGSLKQLHRLILTSAAYRQSSGTINEKALQFDSGNSLLWRQNRRKLEAEALRDSVLATAGKLDLTMGGPSFQDFVITHPEHSPHYEYHLADPENPALHRRSIYRFLARSQQQPWMAAMDCADPSMLVEKRNQTITPLQALAQLNNQLMIVMAQHFAARADQAGPALPEKLEHAFELALQRRATPGELRTLTAYAHEHGLTNACRLILNLNEFTFID